MVSTIYLYLLAWHEISLLLSWPTLSSALLTTKPILPAKPHCLSSLSSAHDDADDDGGSDNDRLPHVQRHRVKQNGLDSMQVERNLQRRGFKYIVGSDEAGRGCIAGPVVTASCCILADLTAEETLMFRAITGVNDSKQVKEQRRHEIYQEMLELPEIYVWRVAERSNIQIGASNILKATMDSFQESIEGLLSQYQLPIDQTYSIVDGKTRPKLSTSSLPCRAWVRGDAEVYSVALASVIAKVVRDRMMVQAHERYPQYGFDIHKGYPTRDHILAIHKYGPVPELHRMSFKPLRGR